MNLHSGGEISLGIDEIQVSRFQGPRVALCAHNSQKDPELCSVLPSLLGLNEGLTVELGLGTAPSFLFWRRL